MESSCGVTAEQWAMARKAGRKAAVISVLPEAFNREGAKEREKQTGCSFIKNRPWGGGGGMLHASWKATLESSGSKMGTVLIH